MSQGINPNVVRGWRKIARKGAAAVEVVQRQFVSVVASMSEIIKIDEKSLSATISRW